MTQKPVKRVYYAFNASTLSTDLADAHAAYAIAALASHFSIPPEAVTVSRKCPTRSDEFQLTCYVGDSTTCTIAMVAAAKCVLPHLRACSQRAALSETAKRWSCAGPSPVFTEEEAILRGVAAGEILFLTNEQQDFVRSRAAEALGLTEPSVYADVICTMTPEMLAAAVLWQRKHRPRSGLRLAHE